MPFALVAVLGLVGGAVLDIYSSGLALLSLGLRIPRWTAALVDGVIMVLGTVYVVFVADDFLVPFQGFLYTLGVPVAAWAGVMLADVALRRRNYADAELYDPSGRYGDVRWTAVALVVVATVLGWGLVTNSNAEILTWQGFARAARARRPRGRLGVRQPGRARRARPRVRRDAGAGTLAHPGAEA